MDAMFENKVMNATYDIRELVNKVDRLERIIEKMAKKILGDEEFSKLEKPKYVSKPKKEESSDFSNFIW